MKPWRAKNAHNWGVVAKLEPWRVCRPVIADLNHLDEEQDPDPHLKGLSHEMDLAFDDMYG
jgi:hypothetical protein